MHDFYSSHVHQMANQARQSPPESSANHTSSPIANPIHNANSSYYHHYHTSGVNSGSNAGYSPPQNNINGNESPNSVDQFNPGTTSSNNNNAIQLPETPNSLVTMMGPTSGNSNSNDGNNAINESPSENASLLASNNNNNNNNYSPWCASTGQLPLSNSPIHSSSYSTPHHHSASLYSAAAHHNLLPHQNISSFVQHPQKGFNHLSQPFYSWY